MCLSADAGTLYTTEQLCEIAYLQDRPATWKEHRMDDIDSKTGLTCITPASSQSVCKAHNIGTEHDTCPELAGDKGCKGPSNEETRNDVASRGVYCRNPKDEGGSEHQQKSISCSHTANLQIYRQQVLTQQQFLDAHEALTAQANCACLQLQALLVSTATDQALCEINVDVLKQRRGVLTISGSKLVASLAHEHSHDHGTGCGDHTCKISRHNKR